MLEIFFLGTSAGIPSPKRNMPCIALRWKGEVILWDVGECCQRELMKRKVGYGSIRKMFISHLHLDHYLGIFGLIETLRMTTEVEKEGLDIYAPGKFSDKLINRWEFMRVHRLKEGFEVQGDEYVIKAFRVKHEGEAFGFVFKEADRVKFDAEKAKSLGVEGEMFSKILKKGGLNVEGREILLSDISYVKKGRKVVYSGDTMYCERLVEEAEGADVLIHESTFGEEKAEEAKVKKHSSVVDAAKAAEKAGVKKLILTHVSARYEDGKELIEQAKKHFRGEVLLAEDGMKVVV